MNVAVVKPKRKAKQYNEPRRNLGREIRNHWPLYLYILPALVYLIVFDYVPMYGIQIAFKNFNPGIGIINSPWVGFKHFITFFEGYYFGRMIRNTFLLSLYSLVIGFPIPILVALMLNELGSVRYRRFAQTLLYAPHFISMVVMIGILTTMFSPTIGVVNKIITLLGGDPIYFMIQPTMFRHLYVWSGVWQGMGWGAVIYLAALSTVSMELHEAAMIDGASRLKRIIHINIPTIAPTIIIMLILRLGNLASVGYEKVYLMLNDMNREVAEVISTFVYTRGIESGQFSYTAAVGLFDNVVNVTFLLIANFIARRTSETSLF